MRTRFRDKRNPNMNFGFDQLVKLIESEPPCEGHLDRDGRTTSAQGAMAHVQVMDQTDTVAIWRPVLFHRPMLEPDGQPITFALFLIIDSKSFEIEEDVPLKFEIDGFAPCPT